MKKEPQALAGLRFFDWSGLFVAGGVVREGRTFRIVIPPGEIYLASFFFLAFSRTTSSTIITTVPM